MSQEREPAEGRPMPELPPDQDTEADPLPPAAVEEARRWKDVESEDPEESTGIDAG
jgi:hypothetical protein